VSVEVAVRRREVPFLVAGRRTSGRSRLVPLARDAGSAPVAVPELDRAMVDRILGQDRALLAGVPFQEIVGFLNRVGRQWESREFIRRRLFVRQAVELLGYSEPMAETEADWISVLLTGHGRMYDMVEVELGSRFVLDEWVPREEAYVRAFPQGHSVHVLAGNVPLSGVTSIVRALLTKNVCTVKLSSRDPVTPVSLGLSFLDIDPEHPVSRALSVVHWDPGSDAAARIMQAADAVCVWGGPDAVRWARDAARPDAAFLPFGHRRSLALVDRDADLRQAAIGIAHDVAFYDQEACFSTLQAFVHTDALGLVDHLVDALATYDGLYPPGVPAEDAGARRALRRLEEEFLGSEVRTSPDGRWTVVTCAPGHIVEHPLGRTLFVHPVPDLREALPFVDRDVQTVSVAPWRSSERLRDGLALAGAARIVEPGLANVFRPGSPHDAYYPLQRLTRVVANERPAAVHGKGMVVRMDQTEALRLGRITDLVL
jgi:long-chain-fatty-acyl-CoA reductase